MSTVLFSGRSTAAHRWLQLWLGLELAVGAVAMWNPDVAIWRNGDWQNRDVLVLVVLVLLVGVAVPMHNSSPGAVGFRFLHGINGAKHRMDETPMNGFLTNLSIRAAITTFLLVGLLQAQYNYDILGDRADAHFLNWKAIWMSPRSSLFVLAAAALGLSLITTMAALLCTDYSLRFEWPDRADKQPNRVKLALRRKAHAFHVIGFYCLMWSLAAATALIDYGLCLVAALAVFLAMWSYYFFADGVKYATVPRLRGLSGQQAHEALRQAGLIGCMTGGAGTNPVVDQQVEAGTEVLPGRKVDFEVLRDVRAGATGPATK